MTIKQNRTTTAKKKKKRPEEAGGGGGGGAGLRLRTCVAKAGPRGQRFRPETPADSLGPEWEGEMLAMFPSDPWIPQRSLPIPTDPLAMSGPLQAWEPLPSPSHPSGVLFPSHLHFSFLSPSFPTMSYPVTWGFLPSP